MIVEECSRHFGLFSVVNTLREASTSSFCRKTQELKSWGFICWEFVADFCSEGSVGFINLELMKMHELQLYKEDTDESRCLHIN